MPLEVVDEHLQGGLEGSSVIAFGIVGHRAKAPGNVGVIHHRNLPKARVGLSRTRTDDTFLIKERFEVDERQQQQLFCDHLTDGQTEVQMD